MNPWLIVLIVIVLLLVVVAIYDLTQKKHTILRNFPIIGHFRYMLEAIGPELRQYIVTSNDEDRPFSRDERRWIYASAKGQNNFFGFGTDNDLDRTPGYIVIRHATFPVGAPTGVKSGEEGGMHPLPAAKIVGATHGRAKSFRPESLVNVSAMSYGALGHKAVEAINRGAKLGGFMQNTGEGGLAAAHKHGGDLTFQIGTGYFGCRAKGGGFSLDQLQETIADAPVRMLEIKLSQGAKPGHGGILPGAKVTAEIAQIRGVEAGKDCISPPGHSAFHDVDSMLEFIEQVADATGLPVGVKSAVGVQDFWPLLARRMRETGTGPDFITIDGGEGGTGAAPLVYTDHVALPFAIGMSEVYCSFAGEDMHENVTFIGSGRLGLPERTMLAFALGCDMVNIAREAMLSIGCIQSRRCHTDKCPTGVTTQNPRLMRGLDPTLKSVRLATYVATLRKTLLELSHTCGALHPALVHVDMLGITDEHFNVHSTREVFHYAEGWGHPGDEDIAGITRLMEAREDAGGARVTPVG